MAVLARSLGYTSESAFSNAFKRVTGSAPKRYRTTTRALGSNGSTPFGRGTRAAGVLSGAEEKGQSCPARRFYATGHDVDADRRRRVYRWSRCACPPTGCAK